MEAEVRKPEEIEKRSFAIIREELEKREITLPGEEELITMRVIHATADFDFAETLNFRKGAIEEAKRLICTGVTIVTDTNMVLSGINQKALLGTAAKACCFMADEEVGREARERGITRASVCVEHAAKYLQGPVMFVVGNAPTALITLHELYTAEIYTPAFVIGVPVGFVNVELSKELILEDPVMSIVARGRKGGSTVAAAIVNALLYQCTGYPAERDGNAQNPANAPAEA